jgi:hypothetical protein
MDVHDVKWEKHTIVEWQESPGNIKRRKVTQTLDEMIQLNAEDEPVNLVWKLTCGNRIMPEGTEASQGRNRRIQEIYEVLVEKKRVEMADQKKNDAYQHNKYHDNQMKDDDDDEEEEDETDNYMGQNNC